MKHKQPIFSANNKFFYLIIALFFSSVVYGQINVRDSLQAILQNETLDSNARWNMANRLIQLHAFPKEAEELAMEMLYPFVQKTWNTEREQLAFLSRIYMILGRCHIERGGDDREEQERSFFEKAREVAVKSGDNEASAQAYNAIAYMELKRGDMVRGHEYLYKAIIYFDKMERYVKSAEMLYVIASGFIDVKDAEGVNRVLQQMQTYLEKDNSKQSQYQYNVIRHIYFWMLLERDKLRGNEVDYALVDSMLIYIHRNIDLVENHLDELSRFWMHGYVYFYLAKELNTHFPDLTDSIFRTLDRALAMHDKEWFSRQNESSSAAEFLILTNTVRANALHHEGRTQEAYNIMSAVMRQLENFKGGYKNLDWSREWAYLFMYEYYKKANNPAQALKYLELLREKDEQRFENKKIQALNDMLVKYETGKKELQIKTLAIKQRNLRLIVGLSQTLLIITILLFISSYLKRKNTEQKLYETALLAELRQNELEKVQSSQQQLEQDPIKNTVENIAHQVSISFLEKDVQQIYLERLSKIDTKLLEQAYQTSKVKITGMDIKYIICFLVDMETKDIGLLFNIDPPNVRTVRYRIRKKFANEDSFRVIL